MSYEKSIDDGLARMEQGDLASAAQMFKDCTRQKPGEYNAWLYLGIALTELEDYTDALAALKQCTKINPAIPHAFTNMGIVYQKLNDMAEATRHFFKATKVDPADVNAHLNLGMAYYKTRNKTMEALLEFKFVLEHDEAIPEAWASAGLIFVDLQKKDLAMFCFQKAEAMGYKDSRLHGIMLDFKVDGVKPKNPLDPDVKETAFLPMKKDVLTQKK
jgi:tetratricopeptide (TPR) repeat protein